MIYIDDNDPEGVLEASFPSRDVTIKWGVDAKGIFEIIDEIGRGKFGTVFKCRDKETGLRLAAKFVPIPKREDRRNVEREVEIMNSLQHHLVIQLYAAFEYQKMMCVVQELVEGGELFDRVIDDEFVLTERVCAVFMRQVCEAMQFIHRNNILHLDLKPENILCLTKEGNRIKIIDFGLARKYDPDKKLQILFGTPEFVAPEVVNFDCISYGTDMWSVGVICYVLLSGLSPFMGETDIATMANVTIAKYDFDDEAFNNVSADAMDFITKILLKDCSSRMTATDCLNHKWLKRRPKVPSVSPKPINITPPSPVPFLNETQSVNETKELDQTKDNLKNFIERWEEHPNSPYVFDSESNLVAPLRNTKADSINSSRACSPSPCESIGSSLPENNSNDLQNIRKSLTKQQNPPNSDEHYQHHSDNNHNLNLHNHNIVNNNEETEQYLIQHQQQKPEDYNGNEKVPDEQYNQHFKDYLQSFDRRNSDTNYLLNRRPSGERINLADEIRKLSDHLLMLAEINTKFGQDNNTENVISCNNLNQNHDEIMLPPSNTIKSQNSNDNNIINNHIENTQDENLLNNNEITTIELPIKNHDKLHKKTPKLKDIKQKTFNSSFGNKTKNSVIKNSKVTTSSAKSTTTTNNNTDISNNKDTTTITLPNPKIELDTTFTIKRKPKLLKASSLNESSVSSSLSLILSKNSLNSTRSRNQAAIRLQNSLDVLTTTPHSNTNTNTNTTTTTTTPSTITTFMEMENEQCKNDEQLATYKMISSNTNTKNLDEQELSAIKSNDYRTSRIFNGFTKTEQVQSIKQLIENTKNPSRLINNHEETSSITILRPTVSFRSAFNPSASPNTTDRLSMSVPWTITSNKRTKFRINQTSRDVPLDSPNTHQTYNLEEAATTTKDCLLHLLEKYHDKKLRNNNNHNGRHQSISVDWNVADNLEYRSINSINTFFQRHTVTGRKVKQLQAQLESKK